MHRLTFAVLALFVAGLATTVLAMQPVPCTRCGHWEGTVTWYYCEECNEPFSVVPCQSEDGQLPPSPWTCPRGHQEIQPSYALCYYVDCTGGAFWP